MERGKLKIVDAKEKEISFDDFVKRTRKVEPNFWIRYKGKNMSTILPLRLMSVMEASNQPNKRWNLRVGVLHILSNLK